MYFCETCKDEGFLTNFPVKVLKNIASEKKEELKEVCIEHISYPCPDCKPLEYKIHRLELKCDKLERWFRKYIENGRAGHCEACLNISPQEIIEEELPVVKEIVRDEVWLESERRKQPVSEEDPEVQKHVLEIIKKDGSKLREDAVDKIRRKKKKSKKKDINDKNRFCDR